MRCWFIFVVTCTTTKVVILSPGVTLQSSDCANRSAKCLCWAPWPASWTPATRRCCCQSLEAEHSRRMWRTHDAMTQIGSVWFCHVFSSIIRLEYIWPGTWHVPEEASQMVALAIRNFDQSSLIGCNDGGCSREGMLYTRHVGHEKWYLPARPRSTTHSQAAYVFIALRHSSLVSRCQ